MGLRFQIAKLLRNGYFAGHVNYDNVEDGGTLDNIVTVANLTNKSWTIAGQPDVPRNVVLTVVDTTPSITAGTVTVTGVGAYGQTLVETFNCASGAGTYTGNCAFARITTIVTSGFTVLGGSGDETFKVGAGLKIGLPCYKLKSVYKTCVGGVNEAVGTVDTTYGTIITTTAPDDSRDFDISVSYTHLTLPRIERCRSRWSPYH